MTPDELASARTSYTYVPARLIRASPGSGALVWNQIELNADMPAETDWRRSEFRTNYSSVTLDEFHTRLLRGQADERLHGLASVMFWGFASGTDGCFKVAKALARVRWLSHGKGEQKPQSISSILENLDEGMSLLDEGDVGRAMEAIRRIKHFGMSFASKVLMFADPSRAAVYDSVIGQILSASRDPALKAMAADVKRLDAGARPQQVEAYAAWTAYCSAKAATQNAIGNKWTDWNSEPQTWRAVDVERAMFASGRPKVTRVRKKLSKK